MTGNVSEAEAEPRDVWQFNEYEVSVGDRGLVFRTRNTTAEVGWRHIVSAEHEIRSGIRIPTLTVGIILTIVEFTFMIPMAYSVASAFLGIMLLSLGILLIIRSIRRKKFIGRIKVATGDTYQLSGEAAKLEEFLSVVRKKVWGK